MEQEKDSSRGSPKSLDEFDARELGSLKRSYSSGNEHAALDAAVYCRQHGVQVPVWLLDALIKSDAERLLGVTHRRPGRAGNPHAQYKCDLVDFTRWDRVVSIREAQTLIDEELAIVRALPKVRRAVLKELEKQQACLGQSRLDAFALASVELEGNPAAGGPDAIEKSYKRVQRNRQSGRYRVLHPRTLRHLGLERFLQT